MERYLLIDVRIAFCSRKHIISKRKQVHTCRNSKYTSWKPHISNSKTEVLTIEVFGKWSIHTLCYYIMQAFFSRFRYATVSRVETVKADIFPHSEAVLALDDPIHSTRLSRRISPSRPYKLNSFFRMSISSKARCLSNCIVCFALPVLPSAP